MSDRVGATPWGFGLEIDEHQRIVAVAPGLCARLGCEERSLVGQGLDDLFSPRDRKGQRRRGRAGWPKSSR